MEHITHNSKGMSIPTVEAFTEEIKGRLETLYPEYKVTVKKVLKNNGVTLTGILIQEQEYNISPVLYLDEYYEMYQSGTDIEKLSQDIAELYLKNCPCPTFNMENITDWEKAKEQVCLRLVNAEKNRELLKTLPYRPFLDLAVVYYIPIHENIGEHANASLTVSESLMRTWGVDEAALYARASQNTPVLMGSHILPITDVIKGFIQKPHPEDCTEKLEDCFTEIERPKDGIPELYVASNNTGIYGAAVLLNGGLLEQFAARCGGSFHILPSSTHELLFLSAKEDYKASLSEMVKHINKTVLNAEEILSDSVYRYCAEDGRMEIAG